MAVTTDDKVRHIEEMGGRLSELHKAAVILLEENGWEVLVIGGIDVRRPDEYLQHNYWLAIHFTGVRRKDADASS